MNRLLSCLFLGRERLRFAFLLGQSAGQLRIDALTPEPVPRICSKAHPFVRERRGPSVPTRIQIEPEDLLDIKNPLVDAPLSYEATPPRRRPRRRSSGRTRVETPPRPTVPGPSSPSEGTSSWTRRRGTRPLHGGRGWGTTKGDAPR